ncbi:MAG: dihydropteroate synthase [Gemmatimonadales bacterium]|nr:dihydropteroate synthase [Gemmatimonadales bacterium]
MRDALVARGWAAGRAEAVAGGLQPLALLLDGLDEPTRAALVRHAAHLGLDHLSGDDWCVLAGSRARLSAFARPHLVDPLLYEAAMAVGLALPAEPPALWSTAHGPIALDAPVLMGILNATPDSFSDGGRHAAADAALARAERLVKDGATMLDVGGESTRPGRTEVVPAAEERARVVPVVAAVARRFPHVPISIDTVKAEVAEAALDAGAAVINDVSAFRLDPAMAPLAAARRAGVVLMHSRGDNLQLSSYDLVDYGGDVTGGVVRELRQAVDGAVGQGVSPEAIVVDPGFGFGKTPEQNLVLQDQLAALQALGRPVLVGPSRKRFLGQPSGLDADARDAITGTACALAYERGARLFRVHDVARTRDALLLARAVLGA